MRRNIRSVNGKVTGAERRNSLASEGTKKTTLVLPLAIDKNLECVVLMEGLGKNEIVVKAVKEYLEKRHLKPDRIPETIEVHYGDE